MPTAVDRLLAILRETRELVARPGAWSAWSGWDDQVEALAEIDGRIEQLASGRLPPYRSIWVLYAPTGPIQDWSIDNGWGREFLDLSARLDLALDEVYPASERR